MPILENDLKQTILQAIERNLESTTNRKIRREQLRHTEELKIIKRLQGATTKYNSY